MGRLFAGSHFIHYISSHMYAHTSTLTELTPLHRNSSQFINSSFRKFGLYSNICIGPQPVKCVHELKAKVWLVEYAPVHVRPAVERVV